MQITIYYTTGKALVVDGSQRYMTDESKALELVKDAQRKGRKVRSSTSSGSHNYSFSK